MSHHDPHPAHRDHHHDHTHDHAHGCGHKHHHHGSTGGIFLFFGLTVIAIAVLLSSMKLYDGMRFFRSYDRYVTVKGLATTDVSADLAIWSVSFTVTGNELADAQARLEKNAALVISYMKDNGMTDQNIRLQNITVADKQAQTYSGGDGSGPRYVLAQTLIVRTNDIAAMAKASQNVATLLKQGVVLGQPNGGYNALPQYIFTKLNETKPNMIAEATKNARASAEQFAKDSGQKVGQIRSANQGVFEINARDPSTPEGESAEKTIRVVSTVEYYLAD